MFFNITSIYSPFPFVIILIMNNKEIYHYSIKIEKNLTFEEWLYYYVQFKKILLLSNIEIEDYHDNYLDIEIVKNLAKENKLNFYEGYFIHKIDNLSFKQFNNIIIKFFENREKIISISS